MRAPAIKRALQQDTLRQQNLGSRVSRRSLTERLSCARPYFQQVGTRAEFICARVITRKRIPRGWFTKRTRGREREGEKPRSENLRRREACSRYDGHGRATAMLFTVVPSEKESMLLAAVPRRNLGRESETRRDETRRDGARWGDASRRSDTCLRFCPVKGMESGPRADSARTGIRMLALSLSDTVRIRLDSRRAVYVIHPRL